MPCDGRHVGRCAGGKFRSGPAVSGFTSHRTWVRQVPMPHRLRPLALLEDEQLSASAPSGHAALSASAGTGKTHVLTARVFRLLLAGVDPSSILCLTFTKAGAAEMADRIHARLAHWVRLNDDALGRELEALGEDEGD